MSEPPGTLHRMWVDERPLTDWLAGEGFTVVEFDGNGRLWGYTSQDRREVGLWRGLLERQRVPTLLHECAHVRAGHDGHQSQAVEEKIDEEVAKALVDPMEYAFAESQLGGSTPGIASWLGMPRWVIEAYQRVLVRATMPVCG